MTRSAIRNYPRRIEVSSNSSLGSPPAPPLGAGVTQGAAEPGPLLLKVGEVARLLKVSERSVQRLHSIGDLPKSVAVLGSVRWRRTDIENWVAAGCPKSDNCR